MTSRRAVRAVVGFVVGFLGAAATIEAVDRIGQTRGSGEQTEVVLGNIDFEGYCRADGNEADAVLITTDAFGWRCAGRVNDVFFTREIDTDAVCRWQFADDAQSRLVDGSSPDGWRCVGRP